MNNDITIFDEQEIKLHIKSLLTENERYRQEKLAQKISSMKDERTAVASVDNETQTIESILLKLEHKSQKVRKAVSILQRMLTDQIEEVIEAVTQAFCEKEVLE